MTRPSRYDHEGPFEGGAFAGHRTRTPQTRPGVVEHVLRHWDRLDLLALHYYDDDTQGWRILDANPDLLSGADLDDPAWVGRALRIPAPKDGG